MGGTQRFSVLIFFFPESDQEVDDILWTKNLDSSSSHSQVDCNKFIHAKFCFFHIKKVFDDSVTCYMVIFDDRLVFFS